VRILDRQRYWAFFKAYVICFIALVGLYIVIDAFSNLDEFAERADGALDMLRIMGRYYAVHMSQFYDRLCGVISMMAAIFTVTWMQKNNELLAMLAAGISTQRVIRPVWISAVLVSGLAVANQELIMPRVAEELQLDHSDNGQEKVSVYSRYDSRRVLIHGKEADRGAQTVLTFNATIPVHIFGAIRELEAKQARYIPTDDPRAPLKGGWLLRGARMSPPVDDALLKGKEGLLVRLRTDKGFPPPVGEFAPAAEDETFFLHTDLRFEAVTRKRQWYQFATTWDLVEGLSDPANEPERVDISVFLHSRILRPLLSLNLMFLGLPLVLSGYGRNMFINLGLSLGTSAIFYGACFLSTQFLGANGVLPPALSAWAPLIGFGTVAVARWDTIRT
jgi:lipopolysaccharide export system permease protein